jgi:DedD protein
MTAKPQTPPPEDPAAELRGKLVKRLAVAGILVAILLGVLTVFDYLSAPVEEAEAPIFSQPVPVAPKKEISQPVTPTTNLPEPPAGSEALPAAAPGQKPAEPTAAEKTAAPAVTEPPPPVVAAEPALAARPAPGAAVESKAARPAAPARSETLAPKRSTVTEGENRPARVVVEPAPMPEGTTSPAIDPRPAAPSARVVQAPPKPAPSGISRLFSGFVLQAGVFNSPEMAEELHAKLALSGVQSTLETRVQVGPFKTRQEAEAAQQRLRELGIESVLVPPKGARR